jgi:serine/threonine protein kinase
LNKKLSNKIPIPVAEIENAWIQILTGFYLAQKSFCFVHNDIKPDNILISKIKKEENYNTNGRQLHLPVGSLHYYITDYGASYLIEDYQQYHWNRTTPGYGLKYPLLYLESGSTNSPFPIKGPDSDIW